MPDIIAAADETAASNLVLAAETTLGTLTKSGSGSLGPFTASWNASASFSGGTIDLIVPNVVRIANTQLSYSLGSQLFIRFKQYPAGLLLTASVHPNTF